MHCLARQPICLFIAFAAAISALAAVPAGSYLVPSKHEAAIGYVLTLRFDAGARMVGSPRPGPGRRAVAVRARRADARRTADVRPARIADNFSPCDRAPGVTLMEPSGTNDREVLPTFGRRVSR
jgi:hypothetical protein